MCNDNIIRRFAGVFILASLALALSLADEVAHGILVEGLRRLDTSIPVISEEAGSLLKLIDALDDDDDVQTVWGNYEVSDAVMEKLG